MALMNGGFLHYMDIRKFLKEIFFSETAGQILKYFHRNVPWVTLFKNCSRNFDPSINMALVNGFFFALYGHKEIFKKSSSPKTLVRF